MSKSNGNIEYVSPNLEYRSTNSEKSAEEKTHETYEANFHPKRREKQCSRNE